MDTNVFLAQTKPSLGELSKNLDEHLRVVTESAERGADLVVFPELSLTGYFLKDQTAELALELDSPALGQLADASKRVSIAAGFVERHESGRLYNAIGFFEDGKLLSVHRKVHLVAYGLFDESRDLAAGEAFRPIESKHGRFGVLICEDMWHVGGAYLYFLDDVDALLVCSSSPARGVGTEGEGLASQRVWGTMATSLALWFQTWVVYVNRVGWEDGIGFGGGSRVLDPFGGSQVEPAGIEPALLETRLSSAVTNRARVEIPLRRDEKPWLVAAELQRHAGWNAGAGDR